MSDPVLAVYRRGDRAVIEEGNVDSRGIVDPYKLLSLDADGAIRIGERLAAIGRQIKAGVK